MSQLPRTMTSTPLLDITHKSVSHVVAEHSGGQNYTFHEVIERKGSPNIKKELKYNGSPARSAFKTAVEFLTRSSSVFDIMARAHKLAIPDHYKKDHVNNYRHLTANL